MRPPSELPTYPTRRTDSRDVTGPQGGALQVSVHNENHVPVDGQAVVKLTNKANQNVLWQTTQEKSLATFSNLTAGEYDVEVMVVGYLSGSHELTFPNDGKNYPLDITLKPDPNTVEHEVSHRQQLPGRARKNLRRGVRELNAGNLTEAQKKLQAAYKIAPASSEVNFFLGYLSFQTNDFEHSETYLVAATKLDPYSLPALTLLGRLYLQNKNYDAARATLEKAVKVKPEDWMAHNLLAEVYLKQNQAEPAKEQAELALEKGQGRAYAARLPLGEALMRLGQNQSAVQTLQAYLRDDSTSQLAAQARGMITELEKRDATPATTLTTVRDHGVPIADVDRVLKTPSPAPSLEGWHPPGVDDTKPAVVAGVICPYQTVIEQAGNRVKSLVDSLAKFDALESMLHEELDEFGVPKSETFLKFNYVASISESKPGILLVDEYRTWHSQAEDFPDGIATRGLPALAFVFHPNVRDNFEMKCEGLGTWNGTATWLMRFQQREDKPHHTQEYVVNGRVFPVSVKGRAWIAADNFQIVRLESDLVRPIPEILLFSQHWSVDYGPVRFTRQNEELWLPTKAELYFNFLKHRYFRRHSFDHFMLFSVDTEEKRKEPTPQPDRGPA
jgi:thioredoxin-like negative regulator of GroEL